MKPASVEVTSLAPSGHRIWDPASQSTEASAVVREAGADREWAFSAELRRAALRFFTVWPTICGGNGACRDGRLVSVWSLAVGPSTALSVPINPQARGDFYLAAETA